MSLVDELKAYILKQINQSRRGKGRPRGGGGRGGGRSTRDDDDDYAPFSENVAIKWMIERMKEDGKDLGEVLCGMEDAMKELDTEIEQFRELCDWAYKAHHFQLGLLKPDNETSSQPKTGGKNQSRDTPTSYDNDATEEQTMSDGEESQASSSNSPDEGSSSQNLSLQSASSSSSLEYQIGSEGEAEEETKSSDDSTSYDNEAAGKQTISDGEESEARSSNSTEVISSRNRIVEDHLHSPVVSPLQSPPEDRQECEAEPEEEDENVCKEIQEKVNIMLALLTSSGEESDGMSESSFVGDSGEPENVADTMSYSYESPPASFIPLELKREEEISQAAPYDVALNSEKQDQEVTVGDDMVIILEGPIADHSPSKLQETKTFEEKEAERLGCAVQ